MIEFEGDDDDDDDDDNDDNDDDDDDDDNDDDDDDNNVCISCVHSHPRVWVLQGSKDGVHGDCVEHTTSSSHQQRGRLHPLPCQGRYSGRCCCCWHRVLQGKR